LSLRRHDGPSRLAPLEDRLARLLKGVQEATSGAENEDVGRRPLAAVPSKDFNSRDTTISAAMAAPIQSQRLG
jgi:hypothetical protein